MIIPLMRGPQRRQIHRDRKWDGGCQGEGNGEVVFSGEGVPVWEDEKVQEMDGGDGCTAVWMHLLP